MTTISQPRQLNRAATGHPTDLATTALRRLRARIAGFTAHGARRTSAAAPARDIGLRAHRTSAGPSLTASQRFHLPR